MKNILEPVKFATAMTVGIFLIVTVLSGLVGEPIINTLALGWWKFLVLGWFGFFVLSLFIFRNRKVSISGT